MVGLTSFSPPTEGIRHEQPSTTLIVTGREIGVGTLYIAESSLSWRNDASGTGFSLFYPHISLHAVSRDIEKFGSECLYLMIDSSLEEEAQENEDGEDNDDDEEAMTEMRFVPADKGQLDTMYSAMTYCQGLHPDPDCLSDDDEEYLDADEEDLQAGGDSGYIEGSGLERSNGHTENHMEVDGQFEDAEEDGDD